MSVGLCSQSRDGELAGGFGAGAEEAELTHISGMFIHFSTISTTDLLPAELGKSDWFSK